MPIDPPPTAAGIGGVPLEAAQDLMRHLRENPVERHRSVDELSQSYGLHATYVQSVLVGLSRAPAPIRARDHRAMLSLRHLWHTFIAVFDSYSRRPFLFLTATIGISGLFAILAVLSEHLPHWILLTFVGIFGFSVPAVVALHGVCFYRCGRIRIVLWGTAVAFTLPVVISVVAALAMPANEPPLTDMSRGTFLIGVVALIAALALLYGLLGCLLSVIGSYRRMLRDDILERSMDRKEVLRRYLEIRERLRLADSAKAANPKRTLSGTFNRYPEIISAVSGMLVTLAGFCGESYEAMKSGVVPAVHHLSLDMEVGPGRFIAGLGGVAVWASIGYLSKSTGAAIRNGIAAAFGGYVFLTVPGVYWWKSEQLALFRTIDPWFDTALVLAVCTTAHLCSAIQDRALHDHRLASNDSTALLEELAKLEWRIQEAAATVTVMVVDAVKSTLMKTGADPLTAEYTFRLYQDWIARTAVANGGTVQSTAGDGAILNFSGGGAAFLTAKLLLADLARFNSEENQLATPFRIRIGIHRGAVSGDIRKVVFTQVIDIAAHVEKAATANGIAATQGVVEDILKFAPEEPFAALAGAIDGETVFVAMNPMLDP